MSDELHHFALGGRLQAFLPTASKQLKAAGYSRKQRAQALRDSVANTILDAEIEGTNLTEVTPAAVETVGAKLGAPRGKGASKSSSIPKLVIREPIRPPPPPPVRRVTLRSPSRSPIPSSSSSVLGARPKTGPPPRFHLTSVAPERRRSRSRSKTPVFGSDFDAEIDYWRARLDRDNTEENRRRASEVYDRIQRALDLNDDSD